MLNLGFSETHKISALLETVSALLDLQIWSIYLECMELFHKKIRIFYYIFENCDLTHKIFVKPAAPLAQNAPMIKAF